MEIHLLIEEFKYICNTKINPGRKVKQEMYSLDVGSTPFGYDTILTERKPDILIKPPKYAFFHMLRYGF